LTAISTLTVIFRLHHALAGSPLYPAESGSSSYGLPVSFQLLSTLSHGNAVIFSFDVMAYADRDFHPADVAPSRAHECKSQLLQEKASFFTPIDD